MQDFTDGKHVSLPQQLQRLSDDVDSIELRLRALIANATSDDWTTIPDHVRVRADERITTEIRENPGVDRVPLETVTGRLAYCDLRGLEQTIVSKTLWPKFADVFGTKEMLNGRFRQLSPLRNANAHLRDVDDLVRSDAEAAVIWFSGALSRVEGVAETDPVDLPMEDEPDSKIEAVSIDELETDGRAS